MTTKPDHDDRERERWLNTKYQLGTPETQATRDLATLRRRDLRERKRGMAMAALRIAHRDGEECAFCGGEGVVWESTLRQRAEDRRYDEREMEATGN